VEVHHDPDHALSDGAQSIYPDQFDELMSEIRQIAAILHRNVQEPPRVETAAVRAGG
jgi:3-deoxy-7-phosphoheptulonate synthase